MTLAFKLISASLLLLSDSYVCVHYFHELTPFGIVLLSVLGLLLILYMAGQIALFFGSLG